MHTCTDRMPICDLHTSPDAHAHTHPHTCIYVMTIASARLRIFGSMPSAGEHTRRLAVYSRPWPRRNFLHAPRRTSRVSADITIRLGSSDTVSLVLYLFLSGSLALLFLAFSFFLSLSLPVSLSLTRTPRRCSFHAPIPT